MITEELDAIEEVIDEALKKPKEEKDPAKLKQKKPPTGGLCRRCGQTRPINRLMLCYPCWVKTVLEKSGWREGMSHPEWCGCEGISEHQRRTDGN